MPLLPSVKSTHRLCLTSILSHTQRHEPNPLTVQAPYSMNQTSTNRHCESVVSSLVLCKCARSEPHTTLSRTVTQLKRTHHILNTTRHQQQAYHRNNTCTISADPPSLTTLRPQQQQQLLVANASTRKHQPPDLRRASS
uniref:Uncharacterized protein n=1 Tax=Vitrella brassicaformis TaxID=1169539 RepID=A0A6U4DTD5_9ALVE|mmetsp:Transcript_33007/g.81741  ORF Transcript_33007/g.81741 Transcript_33007/m.81741 type:complete len:139 (+) Transcript_33007:706-1122(+)